MFSSCRGSYVIMINFAKCLNNRVYPYGTVLHDWNTEDGKAFSLSTVSSGKLKSLSFLIKLSKGNRKTATREEASPSAVSRPVRDINLVYFRGFESVIF